ncbi:M56 family metallopeptidase [Rufibacter hautae]|uniref:M56 family metallopeptidase n=1 Tax=Rufibacter hautae TaxID=2595005 RepID=A0A5B6TGN9_9BACT|nr:M56 family metallopeptidase [Rufibacter hautae]KAA3439433.1 M56 family metallopeptidase [Rufibacter hautae]
MPALLLYLLQVNVGLALFYATYRLVLRQTTFHQWNRLFLLAGLVLPALLPLFDLSRFFKEKQQLYQTLQSFSTSWQVPQTQATETPAFDFWLIPVLLFWLGVGLMTVRLVVQIASLYHIHRKSGHASYQGIPYRQIEAELAPFSFGKAIYFNPGQHPPKDWRPILEHEHTHVRQWHTLDILLMEITTLFNWFNPVVWLLRKALKQNLEFLTDQQTLQAGIDRKQYQFSLLQTTGAAPLSFTSSFSYPSLKHRIMMMNKTPSGKAQKIRFVAVVPLLLSGLLACHGIAGSSEELGEMQPQEISISTLPFQNQYDAFLERNPSVRRITWSNQAIQVHLKSGTKEQYASTPEGIAQAEKKYGTLPVPPPPPPVPAVPVDVAAPPLAPDAALAPPPPPPPFNVDITRDFKQRNPKVQGLSISEESIYVVSKSGEVESFDNTPSGRAAFEKKFGKLPPPPPPVPAKNDE